jgi:hypothetical protein
MICTNISEIIGLSCHPLSDDGNVAMIDTPFAFADGDSIPVFVEKAGGKVRFFDDGGAILHLRGRGVFLDDHRKTRFIKNLAEPNGVALSDMGELEIWSDSADAPAAFAKYVSTMLALVKWEHEQIGVGTDMSLLIDEVALCLRAWKPMAKISTHPEYAGISGHVYKLDFSFDGDAVIATGPHHAAVSTAAKKLLDIRALPANAGLKLIVVLDDRHDAAAARREGLNLDSVANVLMMSRLERNAAVGPRLN